MELLIPTLATLRKERKLDKPGLEGKITKLRLKLSECMNNWVRLTNREDIPLSIDGIDFDETFEQEEQGIWGVQNNFNPGGTEAC